MKERMIDILRVQIIQDLVYSGKYLHFILNEIENN